MAQLQPPPPDTDMPRLRLSPHQNQDFRLLLRVCQTSLVAIEGYGNPFVTETLQLLTEAPSLLGALLAIASQHRRQPLASATVIRSPYQRALVEVQRALSSATSVGSPSALLPAVVGAHILVILSISGLDDWQHHASHIVHLIDCSYVAQIKSSELGMYLVMFAAHVDIAAFAVGRSTISAHAWPRWQLDETDHETHTTFCAHEIVTGYPSSLLSIISEIDSCALQSRSRADSHGSPLLEITGEHTRLQQLLESWEPPPPPEDMPATHKLALQVARRIFQRAALLYHARNHGFYANVLTPLAHVTERARIVMVEDIVFGIRHLVSVFHLHRLPLANAMAWPLAVAGSECGTQCTHALQPHILSLVDDMESSFEMSHLKLLKTILQAMWRQASNADHMAYLSLESAAREHNVTVFLV